MLSIYNLMTVARFEIKTLLRSWFFRIFSLIAILLLSLLNVFAFTDIVGAPWMLRAVPASIPYTNIMLLNVIQAVIALFLASDFLKRDKKLDTTEVVYMRSMTNADYVLGKTLGILSLFVGLNLLVLLIAGIINGVVSDVPVSWISYLLYPLLISLPTLIFIFGLSFLLMVLIRNQAVTFIVLLGYIAITLFFLGNRFHHLFDYMAFYLPMLHSDFTGFGNLESLLIQRGIYFCLGLSAIFGTVLLLKRLPQSVGMRRISFVFMVITLTGGLFLGGMHVSQFRQDQSLRQKIIALNNQQGDQPIVTVTDCDLNLHHAGSKISVQATLSIKNETDTPLQSWIFHLNPGLTVQKVQRADHDLRFDRELHLLTIHSDIMLHPGESTEIRIAYAGTIDEAACYADIDEAVREAVNHVSFVKMDSRYAFITPDYVLLTQEAHWIPEAGAGYRSDAPLAYTPQFTRYRIMVSTKPELTPICQGRAKILDAGRTEFITAHPVPKLSLVIGPYEQKSISVDSVNYSLYMLPGHDYISEEFNALSDTLPALIREQKQDYENKLNLFYPFKQLSLIEVPIQFTGHQHLWSMAIDMVQPEMVLMPEKGMTLFSADIKAWKNRDNRRRQEWGETLTDIESQSRIFRRFISMTLMSENMSGRFGSRGMQMGDGVRLPSWAGGPAFQLNYAIYPNFYTFVHHIKSQEWPILNFAFESYFNTASQDARMQFFRAFSGLSSDEKIGLLLNEESIGQVLREEEAELAHEAMQSKGNQLMMMLKHALGADTFEAFIPAFLSAHPHQTIPSDELLTALQDQYHIDFRSQIDTWYASKALPGFLIGAVEAYQVLEGNHTKYQVKFKMTNPEPVDGLVVITFRAGRRGGGGRGRGMMSSEAPEEYIYQIPAGQSRHIGIVLNEQPRMMMVNTLISQNLPGIITQFFESFDEQRKVQPFVGSLPCEAVQPAEPGAIVVDNEDPGFQVETEVYTSPLRKLLKRNTEEEGDKYKSVFAFQARNAWTPTTHPSMFGKYVHSSHFIRSGQGEKKAAWVANLSKSGNYDVYLHVYEMRWRGRGRGGGQQDHHFFIHHDDGTDEVVLDPDDTDTGWQMAGTYYFSEGEAKIELSNLSEGMFVFADAVKFLKR